MLLLFIFMFSGISCLQDSNDSPPSEIRAPNGELLPKAGKETVEAIKKAAKYIVGQATDDGWGDFTPRAVVALSFAKAVSALSEADQELMMKHLKMHLMRDLMGLNFRKTRPNLVSLASYINALYVTCQDPRDFHGLDLVALLRSEVDAVLSSSNFSYPYVMMSLCIADEIKGEDINRLCDMYNRRNQQPGFKALAITAMICNGHKDKDIVKRIKKSYLKDFFNNSLADMDIYSKALYLQAAIASNFTTQKEVALNKLTTLQQPDGSFGGMLATYSLIPVLLHSSLLDLRCISDLPAKRASVTENEFKPSVKHELVYSLWIQSEQGNETHSLKVPFVENESFLEIMRTAADRSPRYKFLYEDTTSGKKIYSLAGFPNDVQTALKWTLFQGHPNVTIDSPQYFQEIKKGVDKIFPKHKDHFSFHFSRHS